MGLSLLGDGRLLLALVVTVALACPRPRWPLLQRWLPAIAAAAGLTLATKLAFMGWGIGSAALDFTGISGHATMSAAVYPVAISLLAAGHSAAPKRWAWAGVVLVLLVSASRLPLNAHTLSEVVTGSALGLLASGWTLWRLQLPAGGPRYRWLALPLAIACLLPVVPAQFSSHRAVERTAKLLSGNERLHTRKWLHRAASPPRQPSLAHDAVAR